MAQKDGMFSARLKKEGGKLIYETSTKQNLYEQFVKHLEEGQTVEVFFDANKDDGTLAQLALIHKCIRELALETGSTFEDMKREIKRGAGLCIKKEVGGELFMVCKSFSKCSKEELSLSIQTIIEVGDLIGINFR
jgi:hypothetical protein